MDKAQKKKVWSWALYDWGNSAFSTTVMAGFFPLFFKQYWGAGVDPLVTTARLGTVISVSSLTIALLSPTLGIIADLRGTKKIFCFAFTLLGVSACLWMGFIPLGGWESAMLAYGMGMMAFNAASVFYDSLLPYVSDRENLDFTSALGYSLGYLGGGILFAVNVLMYLYPGSFGIADGPQAIKISFIMVGLWWLLFSQPLFKNVPEPEVPPSSKSVWALTQESLATLKRTALSLKSNRNLFIFMLAYWFYIDGVYTVMTMAVDFGLSLGLESKDLITALLITQFVGFPCAYFFGTLTKGFGSKKPILLSIVVYAITVVAATQMKTALHFYLLAAVIGMFQGGVQSLSRSLFARMINKEESGEYFGLFNLVGRFASILGPTLVAVGVTVTGSSRLGMMGLLILFAIGGFLLLKVQEPPVQKGVSGI